MREQFPTIMTSKERLQGVLCMHDRIRKLEAENASLRAAGEELYEAIEFIAFDSEGDWIAGPTPGGREKLLSAWRKATAQPTGSEE